MTKSVAGVCDTSTESVICAVGLTGPGNVTLFSNTMNSDIDEKDTLPGVALLWMIKILDIACATLFYLLFCSFLLALVNKLFWYVWWYLTVLVIICQFASIGTIMVFVDTLNTYNYHLNLTRGTNFYVQIGSVVICFGYFTLGWYSLYLIGFKGPCAGACWNICWQGRRGRRIDQAGEGRSHPPPMNGSSSAVEPNAPSTFTRNLTQDPAIEMHSLPLGHHPQLPAAGQPEIQVRVLNIQHRITQTLEVAQVSNHFPSPTSRRHHTRIISLDGGVTLGVLDVDMSQAIRITK